MSMARASVESDTRRRQRPPIAPNIGSSSSSINDNNQPHQQDYGHLKQKKRILSQQSYEISNQLQVPKNLRVSSSITEGSGDINNQYTNAADTEQFDSMMEIDCHDQESQHNIARASNSHPHQPRSYSVPSAHLVQLVNQFQTKMYDDAGQYLDKYCSHDTTECEHDVSCDSIIIVDDYDDLVNEELNRVLGRDRQQQSIVRNALENMSQASSSAMAYNDRSSVQFESLTAMEDEVNEEFYQ
ncbi:hypothetical protein MP228_002838 [Amoeboaphelidium protococcarum]|nr:hypothetical protein MP228_002838 [Amoeboaphelidium protococcarum]